MGLPCWSGFASTLGSILLVLSFVLSATHSAKITVGGSNRWRFGFNYTDWALKTAPFYQNDTLVFMYDPPNGTTFPHSVYLLKNMRRFLACDLRNATVVGSVVQGGGQGAEFLLKKRKPHYFVCGEGSGFHCKTGLMRFSVHPIRRRRG